MLDFLPDMSLTEVLALLTSKAGIVLVWCALFAMLERLFSVRNLIGQGRRGRIFSNLALFGINGLLNPLLVTGTALLAGALAFNEWRPDTWTWQQSIIIDILLLDCMIYWWHRFNHVFPPLWRFHVVHHLDETLDVSTSVRFHFGEVALSAGFRIIVIILLDIPIESVIVAEVLLHFAAVFHHSRVRLPQTFERMLSYVVVTPSIHWVHHHRIRADTDSNYGNIFAFWDRLFRSRSTTSRTAALPIGVEGLKDRRLLTLLAYPFLPKNRRIDRREQP